MLIERTKSWKKLIEITGNLTLSQGQQGLYQGSMWETLQR